MGALKLIPFKMCEIKVDPSVSSFATANLKKFPAKKCSIVHIYYTYIHSQIRKKYTHFNPKSPKADKSKISCNN